MFSKYYLSLESSPILAGNDSQMKKMNIYMSISDNITKFKMNVFNN